MYLQIVEYNIKSKYLKEYLTVNKGRSLMVNKLGCKNYSGARAHHHHQINRLNSSRLLVISNWLGLGYCSTCCHPLRNACWGRSIPVL